MMSLTSEKIFAYAQEKKELPVVLLLSYSEQLEIMPFV
jgi:hypothetical protein